MNYTEIVNAGVAYADRKTDVEVLDNIDIFLRFGEARLSRLLKVRKASVRATLTLNAADVLYSLPPDYGGLRDIQINSVDIDTGTTKYKTLTMLNPEQLELKGQEVSGHNDMMYYNIVSDQIRIAPNAGANDTLEITYYQHIPPLTSQVADPLLELEDQTTNWVSIDHPDIYLALLMYEIEIFAKNYEVADGWESRLNTALDDLKTTDKEERWSGTPLTIRTDFNSGNRRP